MDLHVYLHMVESENDKLDQILALLLEIKYKEIQIMADLTTLQTQVTANTTVEGSAVILIQGIATQLAAAIASNDPAKLQALQDQLNTSATALAAAVAANTPAAPPSPVQTVMS